MTKGKGATPELETSFHKTIKKVSSDIEQMKFNTAIAAMMTLVNEIYEHGSLTIDELGVFVRLISPFAPHVAEEMWERIGGHGLCSLTEWPKYDEAKTIDASVTIAVQVCGKTKETISIPAGSTQEVAVAAAKQNERIAALLEGKTIVKEIYVKDKIVNIVAK